MVVYLGLTLEEMCIFEEVRGLDKMLTERDQPWSS